MSGLGGISGHRRRKCHLHPGLREPQSGGGKASASKLIASTEALPWELQSYEGWLGLCPRHMDRQKHRAGLHEKESMAGRRREGHQGVVPGTEVLWSHIPRVGIYSRNVGLGEEVQTKLEGERVRPPACGEAAEVRCGLETVKIRGTSSLGEPL